LLMMVALEAEAAQHVAHLLVVHLGELVLVFGTVP
jgi:hypothetical protein